MNSQLHIGVQTTSQHHQTAVQIHRFVTPMLGVYDTRAAHYGALGCGHELPALQAAAVSPRRLVALQAHGQQDLTQMECQMLAK